MGQLFLRFFIGGMVVSTFAIVGNLFKPKSFAGLFGAAPSVALATLGLIVVTEGAAYAASEAHTMMAGAVAFFAYASIVSYVMMRYKPKALLVTIGAIPLRMRQVQRWEVWDFLSLRYWRGSFYRIIVIG